MIDNSLTDESSRLAKMASSEQEKRRLDLDIATPVGNAERIKTGSIEEASESTQITSKIPRSLAELFAMWITDTFIGAAKPKENDVVPGWLPKEEEKHRAFARHFADWAANQPAFSESMLLSWAIPPKKDADLPPTPTLSANLQKGAAGTTQPSPPQFKMDAESASYLLRASSVEPPVQRDGPLDAVTQPTPGPTEGPSDENPLDLTADDVGGTLSQERVGSPTELSAAPNPATVAADPTPPPAPEEPEESPGEIDLDKLRELADTVAKTHGISGLRQLERELRENFPATTNLDQGTELIRERAANVDVVPKSFDLPQEFIGGYEEAILGASMVLRQSENNPELALALATGPLARTVERFERAGLSPMQLVDLVVHLFAGEAVFRNGSTPPANSGFIGFVSRLVALLDQDHDSPADSLFTTRVNLVTWYAQAEGRQCLRHAARLGLDALRHVVEGGSLEPAAARVLQQLANNLAGWLPELSRVASRTETLPKNFGKHLNALHALATVAHLIEQTPPGSTEVLEVTTSMGLRVDERLAGPAVQALMFMTNIPVAWYWLCDLFDESQVGGSVAGKLEPGWYRSSVLTLLSAAMRSRFSLDRDIRNVPAALFNLGVQVIRIGKSEGTEASLPLRILTNGFGLWWALMKGKNLRHSVGEMSAGDCLVNLFGALSEWSNNKRVGSPDLPSDLRTVVDALHPLMNKEDQYRVGNSYKQIYDEEVRSPPRVESEDLARAVTAVLTLFLDGLEGNPGESPDALHGHLKLQKDFCRYLLGALTGAFGHIDRAVGKPMIGDAVAGWLAVAETLATRAGTGDLKPFAALIPVTLDGWYVEAIKDDVRIPQPEKDAPYLSRTLRDVALMREVFGLA